MQTGITIRRRDNGTIHIDHYRQQALALRAQTRTQFFRTAGRFARPLIGAAAIIVAYVLFLPRNPVPPNATAMLVSVPVALMSD